MVLRLSFRLSIWGSLLGGTQGMMQHQGCKPRLSEKKPVLQPFEILPKLTIHLAFITTPSFEVLVTDGETEMKALDVLKQTFLL